MAKGPGFKKTFLDRLKSMPPGVITAQGRKSNKELALAMISMMRQRGRPRPKPIIGKMYYYQYDPKLKQELPYYDIYPVIIPIKYYSDGWLGINLHYVDQYNRAALLDRLTAGYQIGKRDTVRLKISYEILNGAANLAAFKPCVKRYLASHLKTQPLEIDRQDWFMAAMLPLAKFQKASESKVHSDSRKTI